MKKSTKILLGLAAVAAFTIAASPANAEELCYDSEIVEQPAVLETPGDWVEVTAPVDWTGTLVEAAAGFDIDADTSQYIGIKLHTSAGTITYEEDPSYGLSLWSSTDFPDLVDSQTWYPAFAGVDEWVAKYGSLEITSVDLLYTNSVAATATATSVTIGGEVLPFYAEVQTEVPCPVEEPAPTEPAPSEEPAPAVVTPTTPAVTATPTAQLAETGVEEDMIFIGIASAIVLLAGGIWLINRSERKARGGRHKNLDGRPVE